MDVAEETLPNGLSGVLFRSERTRTGIVVLGGSSGRVDVQRAKLLAAQGTTAIALQWFGGPGQPPGICEVPIECFFRATDFLLTCGCRRIIFVGTSKGAEGALLAAVSDSRISAVVAISPSAVVWGNIGAGHDGVSWPERSSWSLGGVPLPFVPALESYPHAKRGGLVSYRGFFEDCLIRFAAVIPAATIRVEDAAAEMLLVTGGDDALWPSETFSRMIETRRRQSGKSVQVAFLAEAGHRVLLPGETTPRSSINAHGGSDLADSQLGQLAWQQILGLL